MTSIVGGSSILHIANRLGGLKKDTIATDGIDSDRTFSATPPSGDILSTPPSSERLTTPPSGDGLVTPPVEEMQRGEETRLTLRLFKDKESYTTSPSTSNAQCALNSRSDLSTAISQIQQLATNHQMASGSQHGLNGPSDILTMRDLLPGYSPWMRNAGRKKSHPVWDFFKDLKDTNGVGGVICLHCTWQGDDRSPNNLRTHLKKFHTVDGVFAKFSEKLAQTPTQPYVKRSRAGGSQQIPHASVGDSMSIALQQLQSASQIQLNNPFNFLENLPKSNEVINISAGFGPTEEEEQENGNEPGSSGASAAGDRATSDSPAHEEQAASGGSPSVSSTNQLSAFMNMAANPLMWNAMLVNSSHGSAFTLNDGQCVSMLMKMALDLDLTLSYHKRRGDIELCFESNRTAEKSGGRGKVLCLSDMGREIRVIERVNGTPTDTEMWTKTDFNQFHWAIRGKCQKVLVKC